MVGKMSFPFPSFNIQFPNIKALPLWGMGIPQAIQWWPALYNHLSIKCFWTPVGTNED